MSLEVGMVARGAIDMSEQPIDIIAFNSFACDQLPPMLPPPFRVRFVLAPLRSERRNVGPDALGSILHQNVAVSPRIHKHTGHSFRQFLDIGSKGRKGMRVRRGDKNKGTA
jgi:hypothetical protein